MAEQKKRERKNTKTEVATQGNTSMSAILCFGSIVAVMLIIGWQNRWLPGLQAINDWYLLQAVRIWIICSLAMITAAILEVPQRWGKGIEIVEITMLIALLIFSFCWYHLRVVPMSTEVPPVVDGLLFIAMLGGMVFVSRMGVKDYTPTAAFCISSFALASISGTKEETLSWLPVFVIGLGFVLFEQYRTKELFGALLALISLIIYLMMGTVMQWWLSLPLGILGFLSVSGFFYNGVGGIKGWIGFTIYSPLKVGFDPDSFSLFMALCASATVVEVVLTALGYGTIP